MNLNELRDYKLTLDEWSLLPGIAARHMTYERKQAHVDMLVLAGLVEHTDAESLALTPDGEAAAAAIDMVFDWEDFALVTDEPAKVNALEEALARPERMTVGSLVRHTTTGGIGLITHHTMWDADWGSFRVEFCGPVDNVVGDRVVNQLREITDRADKFERV